ncbi:retrovirus-related pol polyprotein from transposon TNT 1-94 [Tanacetum coccineum]
MKNNRKKSTGYVKKDDQPGSSGLIYDDSKVMMVMSTEALLNSIMDLGGSYHLTPMIDLFFDFLECDGGNVLLGDNREYKIKVVGQRVLEKQGLFGKKSLGGYRAVKKPRTDNSLEFYNREFEQLRIESRITRHLTVVRMPQQNGLAEQVTCTATYLINRSPSTAIEKKTPMEMWSGHLSDYRMLRIFSCVAYSHVKQGKLEPKAVKCVLLRYLEGVKGYRLYRLDNKSPKIVTRRNVVFNESVMYKDTLKDSVSATHRSDEELQVEVEVQDLNNHYQLVESRNDGLSVDEAFQEEDELVYAEPLDG